MPTKVCPRCKNLLDQDKFCINANCGLFMYDQSTKSILMNTVF